MRLSEAFFESDVEATAKRLLGVELLVNGVGGIITETEAYHPDDPASHSYRGETPRTKSLFGPIARAYVYRSYGIHWCLCLVCGPVPGAAVLIRSLEPTKGLGEMRTRRGLEVVKQLCSGPGKLTQALAITQELDGVSLAAEPFELNDREVEPALVIGPRIGITKAVAQPWRFGIAGSPYLSRSFPAEDLTSNRLSQLPNKRRRRARSTP